jgi:hypothetical protein
MRRKLPAERVQESHRLRKEMEFFGEQSRELREAWGDVESWFCHRNHASKKFRPSKVYYVTLTIGARPQV